MEFIIHVKSPNSNDVSILQESFLNILTEDYVWQLEDSIRHNWAKAYGTSTEWLFVIRVEVWELFATLIVG